MISEACGVRHRTHRGHLMRTAGVPAAGIDTVFFKGGSSGVPLLRQNIAALLPDARHKFAWLDRLSAAGPHPNLPPKGEGVRKPALAPSPAGGRLGWGPTA
jgi:hypothetical protein